MRVKSKASKESLLKLVEFQGTSKKVIRAFKAIPRDFFVPQPYKNFAWEDRALPIGQGQTISQPSLVALMLDSLKLKGEEKVLEIGTGSGWQTALLSFLAAKVFSVEIIKSLYINAKKKLKKLKTSKAYSGGIKNVLVLKHDGSLGLKKYSPYDAIIVTAAFKKVPRRLVTQLKPGGKLIMPLGQKDGQNLFVFTKKGESLKLVAKLGPVRFVPLVGEFGWKK